MNKLERLELEIDLRIRCVWETMGSLIEPEQMEFVAALLRAAYGKGYHDAMREPVRGQLCLDFDYHVPTREKA